ncbi:MAG: alpha/beta fold hydrolase [Pseudomonadales bacterium]|nr:alpha/beta fold hydrolase [Pseudomonadales bacterium]
METIAVPEPAIADVGGARLAWSEFGGGEPLLLIRGLGTQMIEWPRAYVDRFVAAGHRVIVFDNRDCGLSSDHADEDYTVEAMAGDCVGLLDHLGIERARAFGISMGGMIVQHLAIGAGERFSKLVSVMSSTGDPALPRPAPEILAALTAPVPGGFEAAVEQNAAHRALFGSPAWPLDEDVRRALARRALERAWRPDGVARQYQAILADGSRRSRLAGTSTPMLVIHGAADPLVPLAGGEDTAACAPGAELEVIEGMGHDLPEALAPRIVDRVCAFFSA